MQFINDKTWELLKTRGLHFCHLSINSFLSKVYELRDITIYIRPVILGIAETKLDSSVTSAEAYINGYSIIKNDRNRKSEGFHVILEKICVLISNSHSES